MDNHKDVIKRIIEKLTQNSKSVFSDMIFSEAGEIGIGENQVQDSIKQLVEENFLQQPCRGVLKRAI